MKFFCPPPLLWDRCLLLAFTSWICISAEKASASDTLLQTDFGAAQQEIVSGAADRIKGQLPTTVIEDSAWADVSVHYEPQSDRLGSDLKWIRATVSALKSGKAQLKWKLSQLDGASHYRLTTTLGSGTGGRMVFKIMDAGPPYAIHWEKSFNPSPSRENRTFDFQLPAIKTPSALILSMEDEGQYDLYAVGLTRRTEEEIEKERLSAIAAAPENLAPTASFPLGLPSGWSVGHRVSLTHDVDFRAADRKGPHGTTPLVIDVLRDGASYDLYSAPFQMADPTQIHILSFWATGEENGRVRIYCDGKECGSGTLEASPEGKLVVIPFRPDPLAKWTVIHWSGQKDLQIDALNVSMGRQPKPFTLPKPAELALAADIRKANVFVEGESQPVLSFAVTGGAAGAKMVSRTFDLYGAEASAPPVTLSEEKSKGTFTVGPPDPKRPYGSFRTEAWLEREGKKISPAVEVVWHRVPRPMYWGRIAPESKFGNHFHPYEPHLYAAKAIGANWNRFHGANAEDTTYWSAVEPEKGQWVWHKDTLETYRKAGFALCGVLTKVPYWARVQRAEKKMTGWLDNWWQPRDYAEFGEYVSKSATEYAGLIDAWQIWNEPWGEFWFKDWRPALGPVDQWHPGDTPESDFVGLSKVAWDSIKKTGFPGPVLGIGGTFGERGKRWIADMLGLDAEKYCDAISYHAYFGGDLSLALNPQSELMLNLDRRVFQPITKDGAAANMPVWMTEGSWLLRRSDTGLFKHSIPGEKDPLDVVRENSVKPVLYHAVQFSHGTDKVFTYALNAGPAYFKPFPQGQIDWSALVMPNGELSPAGPAYAAMTLRLEKATFQERIQVDEQTAAFVFKNDGTPGRIVVLFGVDLAPWLPKLGNRRADDFLGNPLQPGIRHQLIYIPVDDTADVKALLTGEAAS